jgi:hypothetical protein
MRAWQVGMDLLIESREESGGTILTEFSRLRPAAAVEFLRTMMLLGVSTAILCSAPTFAYLYAKWQDCELCARPLHWWLLVHFALQLLQVPVRLVFLFRLRRAERSSGGDALRLQQCVEELTHSAMWRPNQQISAFTFAWFVLGIVWILNSDFCRPCPSLYYLSLTIELLTLLRGIVTLDLFEGYFPEWHGIGEYDIGEIPPSIPRGAAPEVVERLPLVEYAAAEGWCESACSICLGDFEEGELLRELPCSHKFHGPCVDRWLQQRRTCPLCVHDVHEPPPSPALRRLPRKATCHSGCDQKESCRRRPGTC